MLKIPPVLLGLFIGWLLMVSQFGFQWIMTFPSLMVGLAYLLVSQNGQWAPPLGKASILAFAMAMCLTLALVVSIRPNAPLWNLVASLSVTAILCVKIYKSQK